MLTINYNEDDIFIKGSQPKGLCFLRININNYITVSISIEDNCK